MDDTNESRYTQIERKRIETVVSRVVDVLENDGVVMPTQHASHALRTELHTMYESGRNDAMHELMSMKDLQMIFPDISRSYLQDLRSRLDLGIRVGSDQLTIYAPEDVQRLREYVATDRRFRKDE